LQKRFTITQHVKTNKHEWLSNSQQNRMEDQLHNSLQLPPESVIFQKLPNDFYILIINKPMICANIHLNKIMNI